MNLNIPKRPKRQANNAIEEENTLPLATARAPSSTGIIDNHETGENEASDAIEDQETARVTAVEQAESENQDTAGGDAVEQQQGELPTRPLVEASQPRITISRRKALIGILFLVIVVFNAAIAGNAQFIGSQGWAFVLGGSSNSNNSNPLDKVKQQLHQSPTPGVSATATPLTPAQYIDDIIQNMTLDQKLGQMMIVQFLGPSYSPDISAMINQYNVGAALLFTVNNNIISKPQLTGLISQMQHDSTHNGIPLAVAIDQEGGYVDRLVALDGARPSATSIGATNDPSKAQAEGVLDASDLASYGFNLNLAPVVDVNTVYNPQLYGRTFGNNPDIVTRMAEAYLQGLQKSGKVFGTLKHFPGLGDVATDPHIGVADVYRSKSQLEAIDWAPYRAMIQQGNVHSIMVTHDVLHAIDASAPATLSYKVVTGILRDELGFQGVIMTDSLTMEGITALYSESQAAALAVEAGDDLLMGAATPQILASMIQGIKQAYNSGAISMQRIDDSVRRILTMKYELGLLTLPTN
ncbi:MAG: glycoside hydrolase family 3 protein [Ktedonobacteraceae bacterium]